jgi:hypothetical protein
MHRILFLPDIRPAGYPADPKALFEEKLNKLLDQLNIAGYPVSGLTRYPAGQSGIRPDTGYKKRPDYPAEYPVHP